jgi:hypothetical protein
VFDLVVALAARLGAGHGGLNVLAPVVTAVGAVAKEGIPLPVGEVRAQERRPLHRLGLERPRGIHMPPCSLIGTIERATRGRCGRLW